MQANSTQLRAFWLVAELLVATSLSAADVPGREARELFRAFQAREATEVVQAGLTLEKARQIQIEFVAALAPHYGRRAGYKVGLTSKAVQESLGAKAPARGILFEKMLVANDARVSAKYAARPIFEPDLVAIVKDDGLNSAKTPLEVLAHLTEIVAFIELPDRLVAASVKTDGHLVTAINVSARLGVLGDRRKVEPTESWVKALAEMKVTLKDDSGAVLADARGDALLGNPLNSILWLIEDLKATGERLKPGDILSLGSFSRPVEPKAGQKVTLRYDGLPGGPMTARVEFLE